VTRIDDEVNLLRKHLGGRSPIQVGSKTVAGEKYTGVLVKNVSITGRNFGVSATDMLFLLPPRYPVLPPIGVYLNYKWETVDHHFTQVLPTCSVRGGSGIASASVAVSTVLIGKAHGDLARRPPAATISSPWS